MFPYKYDTSKPVFCFGTICVEVYHTTCVEVNNTICVDVKLALLLFLTVNVQGMVAVMSRRTNLWILFSLFFPVIYSDFLYKSSSVGLGDHRIHSSNYLWFIPQIFITYYVSTSPKRDFSPIYDLVKLFFIYHDVETLNLFGVFDLFTDQ